MIPDEGSLLQTGSSKDNGDEPPFPVKRPSVFLEEFKSYILALHSIDVHSKNQKWAIATIRNTNVKFSLPHKATMDIPEVISDVLLEQVDLPR
jgi:hypothetical protein